MFDFRIHMEITLSRPAWAQYCLRINNFFIYDRFIASTTYAVYKGCGLIIGTRRRHCPFGVQPVFSMVSDQHHRVQYPTFFYICAGVFLRAWG